MMTGQKGTSNFGLNDDQLAQALKDAARAERPVFSETLYAQIIERAAALQSVRPRRAGSVSVGVARTLKRMGWMVLATYAAIVTVAVLIQFAQKVQVFYWSHPEVSSTNSIDSSKQVDETDESFVATNQLVKATPTEPIAHLVSAPGRTVEHMEFALSQIDRQRWANLDHDLRLAQQILQNQLPLGVLSRAETFEENTP